MKNFKKTEFIILATLWVCILATYPYALFSGYVLYTSDYLGFIGLSIATFYSFRNPAKSFEALLILLSLGLFNLLSFIYFFNVVFTFGFSIFVTPGIQILSLALLIIIISQKREKFSTVFHSSFGTTEEESEAKRSSLKNSFKNKLEKLTDAQIEARLQDDLVPEAKEALLEIISDRKKVKEEITNRS